MDLIGAALGIGEEEEEVVRSPSLELRRSCVLVSTSSQLLLGGGVRTQAGLVGLLCLAGVLLELGEARREKTRPRTARIS